ncbi:MAG TPA: fimbrial assembly protein [Mizugakiibacter sp.]|nr:fimbrial assembly protein [Mizugakiibacter sp.]
MPRVNLLPWRIERRKQRERGFYMQLIAAAMVALVVVIGWSMWMGLRIDYQNERNAYMQTQIHQLDTKIAQIKNLDKVRQRLLARKKIIEKLQSSRAQMVHLFDELVKRTPPSIRLTTMQQQGQSMTLQGVAQSDAAVATYMRNLATSPWMGPVDLKKTENVSGESRMPYQFALTVKLGMPESHPAAASSTTTQRATMRMVAGPAQMSRSAAHTSSKKTAFNPVAQVAESMTRGGHHR